MAKGRIVHLVAKSLAVAFVAGALAALAYIGVQLQATERLLGSGRAVTRSGSRVSGSTSSVVSCLFRAADWVDGWVRPDFLRWHRETHVILIIDGANSGCMSDGSDDVRIVGAESQGACVQQNWNDSAMEAGKPGGLMDQTGEAQ
jgi:hypothetical protein